MLSGKSIRREISKGKIDFTGTIRGNSLLLSLGRHLLEFQSGSDIVEPWRVESIYETYLPARFDWATYDLPPMQGVLISALEYLHLPANLGGSIGTLSHVARLGLFAHYSSQWIGPRYAGHICLEILNISKQIIRLKQGMPVAKIVLFKSINTDPETGPEAIPFYYSTPPETNIDLKSRYFEEFGGDLDDESS
jgi:deoxycytidine triphosphate deaminase